MQLIVLMREGLLLHVVSFNSIPDGLPAVVDWLQYLWFDILVP